MMRAAWKDLPALPHVAVAQGRPWRGGIRFGAVMAVASALTFGVTACSGANSSTTVGPDDVAAGAPASVSPRTGSSELTNPGHVGFIVYNSPWSFDATLSVLRKNVASAGMAIFGNLNQGAALKSTGLTLLGAPTALSGAHTFFVGDPTTSEMLLQRDPAVGAVIPLQMYVWTDESGKVHLGHFDSAALFSAIGPKLVDLGREMAMAGAEIAEKTAGRPRTYSDTVPARFIAYDSTRSFDATVNALRQSVASADMMVLADLDPSGTGKRVRSDVTGAQTFFVGHLAKSKRLFEHDPAVGAVIPLRMYVWTDKADKVHLGYFDPRALYSAVDPRLKDGGERMAKVAEQIARGALDGRG